MMKLNKCSYSMACYLWHKWNSKNISEKQIESLFTEDVYIEIFGGYFSDFFYDSFDTSIYIGDSDLD